MFAKNLLTTRKRCTMQHMHLASLVFKVLRTQGIYASVPVMCLWERNFGGSAELSSCCCRRCYYAIRNHVMSSHVGGMRRIYAEMGKRVKLQWSNFFHGRNSGRDFISLFQCLFSTLDVNLTQPLKSIATFIHFLSIRQYRWGHKHSHLELINTRITFAEL